MTDLMIAREANDLRRQAAAARQAGAISDQAFARVDALQNQLENINNQLVENPAMEDEAKAQLTARRDQLRQALNASLSQVGINLPAAGVGAGTQNPDYSAESYGPQ
jgi:DNA-binding protein H-NS